MNLLSSLFKKSDAKDDAKKEKKEKKESKEDKDQLFDFALDDEPVEEKERPLVLTEFMAKLVAEDNLADVTFVVGKGRKQRVIPAHRVVLATCSPLFEAMVYPPSFPDYEGEEQDCVVLIPDEDPIVFQQLLTCIYTDKCEITPTTIQPLIEVSRKYQIEKMQALCANYLSHDINVDNACELFQLAPDLMGSQDFAQEYVLEHADEIFESKGFLNLSRDRLQILARSDSLGADELGLFNALVKWGNNELARQGIEAKPAELRRVLREFIPHVRFPLMGVPDLAGPVAASGLLTEEQLLALFQYGAIKEEKERSRVRPPFNTRPRSGGISKESKLLPRRFKKDLYDMFGSDVSGLKLQLLYRGSRDGFSASAFHSKVDGKGATLTTIKVQNKDNIFGAYHGSSWNSGNSYSSGETWIFSLINQTGKPLKLIPSGGTTYNAHFNTSFGPTFGGTGAGTYDLHINGSMKSTMNSSQPLSFRVAPGYTGAYTKMTLAGSNKFTVDEIEVFAVKEIVRGKK